MPKPKATPDKPRAAAAPGSTSPTSEKPMTIAPGRPGDIGGLVSVKIDDIELKVPFGTTIEEAVEGKLVELAVKHGPGYAVGFEPEKVPLELAARLEKALAAAVLPG